MKSSTALLSLSTSLPLPLSIPTSIPTSAPSVFQPTKPRLVWSPHPLISDGRELVYIELLPNESILEYLKRTGILSRMGHQLFVLTIDGKRVPRHLWSHCYPKPGTLINLYAIVGDGGGGEKNPLATIAMIALMVVAPQIGAFAFGAGTTGALILSAAITVVGGLAINAIFPPPKPQLKEAQDISQGSESPTYSLAGGSNRIRRYEPFIRVMGIHKVFPDFGAQPFSEFEGDDQVAYYTFDYGYNNIVLSQHRIGDNDLSTYTGVQLQESGDDGKISMFPSNVDSVDGAALTSAVGWVVRTTSLDTTAIGLDIAGYLYRVGDAGMEAREVVLQIEYSPTGAGTWSPIAFESDAVPEVAPPSGGEGGSLSKALVRSQQLVMDQQSQGSPLSAGQFRIVNATRKPVRRTLKFYVDPGQYDVRILRVTADETDERVTSDISWVTMKSYQSDTADYTGRKRIGLKIRASGQISGSLDQVNSMVSAKCQVWTGSAWEVQATSNPAWWFLDCARGQIIAGKRVWGAGYDDSKIDIEGIKTFATWCTDQGLTINAVFDQQQSVFDVLSTIALMGRATVSWGTGKLGVIWDAPNLPVTAYFGMHNILPGSFEIEYSTEDLADVIEGEFFNPDIGWQTDFVRVSVPGATGTTKVRKIQLFGRTSRILAAEDTNLYAAQNAYRNRRYKWRSDWEAMPSSRGEVVQLTHDLAALDYSGRFIEGGSTTSLKLSKKVPLYGAPASILIRKPDGTASVHEVGSGAGSSDTLVPTIELAFDPWNDPDHPPYDYVWQYGSTATPGKKVKIERFRPIDERTVELWAIDEIPAFYTAKTNPYFYSSPLTIFGAAPVVSDLVFDEDGVVAGTGYLIKVTATWKGVGNYVLADVRLSVDGAPLTTIGIDVRETTIDFNVSDFVNVALEITAYGNLGRFGKSARLTGSKDINFAALHDPADIVGLTAEIMMTGIRIRWNKALDVDVTEYEIRQGASWAVSSQVFRGLALEYVDLPKAIPATYTYWAKAYDSAGKESVTAVSAQVTIDVIGAPSVNAQIIETDVILTWDHGHSQFALDTCEVRWGADFAGGTSLGFAKVTTLKVPINWSGSRTFWIATTDIAGQTGPAGSVVVSIVAPLAPTVTGVISGDHINLSWTVPTATLPIREYEIRYGTDFATGTSKGRFNTTSHTMKVDWFGNRSFWVAAVDSNGTIGAAGGCEIGIIPPGVPTIIPQVIDNYVLLKWTDVAETLPVDYYEVRRGVSYATATVVGIVHAHFTTLFEDSSGNYTYWVVGVDTAGNYGVGAAVAVTVSQPPDFILYDDQQSDLHSVNRTNWLRVRGDNYMLSLDGSTQYGQVASVPHLDGAITGLTFEQWFACDQTSADGGLIEKTVGGSLNSCALMWQNGAYIKMRVKIGVTLYTAQASIAAYPVGAVLHAIGRWSSADGVSIALQGSNVQTVAATGTLAQGAGILYVGRLATAGFYFDGKLGPGRIYTRRISDTELAEHYHGIFKNEASIVAAWGYEEGTGTTVFDDTDNSYNLQLISDPVWTISTLDGRYDLSVATPIVYYPVYANESVTEFETRTGYATPDAAIAGGYLHPLTPAPTTAQYVEIFDYGTTVPSTKVTLSLAGINFLGSVTITPKISVRKEYDYMQNQAWALGDMMYPHPTDTSTDVAVARGYAWEVTTAGTSNGTPTWPASVTVDVTTVTQNGVVWIARAIWTDYAGVWSAYVTNFRYVKMTLDVSGAGGNNIGQATSVGVKLDVKLRNDGGMAECSSADSGGTTVEFNVAFLDVQSITVTPQSTTPINHVYDFADVPSPTDFKVLLFDPDTGNRVNGTVSWAARGV